MDPPLTAEQISEPFKPAPSGKWLATPHPDGHWVEYSPSRMAEKTGRKEWASYPFSRYRWEWPGITESDKTWAIEDFPGKTPAHPGPQVWIPDNDPFAPGQKMNL